MSTSTSSTPASMHTKDSAARRPSAQKWLIAVAGALALLGAVGYFSVVIGEGFGQAPWGLFVLFVLPFAIGTLLLIIDRRRLGAIVVGVDALAVLVATTIGLVITADDGFPDWPYNVVVLVCMPLAAVTLALAVRVLMAPRTSADSGSEPVRAPAIGQ